MRSENKRFFNAVSTYIIKCRLNFIFKSNSKEEMFNCQKLSKTLINDAMVRKFIRDVVRISHNCSKNL